MGFGNTFLNLKISLFGLKGLKKRLKQVTKDTKGDLNPLARRIVTQLLKEADQPFADSARGRPPKAWARLSQLTVFVRMHRAKRKNKDPKIMVDTGLLRSQNLPFIRKRGREFGIQNRHPNASKLHFGGTGSASSIAIGGHRRTTKSGKESRVRPYQMNIGAGNRIPARPWFPTKQRVLQVIKVILGDFEHGVAVK